MLNSSQYHLVCCFIFSKNNFFCKGTGGISRGATSRPYRRKDETDCLPRSSASRDIGSLWAPSAPYSRSGHTVHRQSGAQPRTLFPTRFLFVSRIFGCFRFSGVDSVYFLTVVLPAYCANNNISRQTGQRSIVLTLATQPQRRSMRMTTNETSHLDDRIATKKYDQLEPMTDGFLFLCVRHPLAPLVYLYTHVKSEPGQIDE